MPEANSKMQVRAQIMHILAKYRNKENPVNSEIVQDVEQIKQLEEKKYVAKLLFKELGSNEAKQYINVCAVIALEVLDNNTFEDYAIEFLQNKNNSDEKKFFVISLIKQKGIYFDYDQIDNYIENAESIAKNGTKGFLSNLLFDPEVQIDLLDFYLNIPDSEKIYLLKNISKEDMPDTIAYAMSLIAQLNIDNEELDIVIESLLDVDSPYGIEGIEYILGNHKINLKIRQKLKNKLKTLNDKYPVFKENGVIENSILNDSYISFIDGNLNFSLILSRKTKENLIDTMLLTVNTRQGIVACMGFGSINISNYKTIVKRLFPDSLPVKINPMVLKAFCKHYENKNNKTKTQIPYEYIVWKKLLTDIKDINYDVSDLINSKLDTINLTEEKVRQFIDSPLLETWYWLYGQNKQIDALIDKIEEEHITELKKIDEMVSDCIDKDFINDKIFMVDLTDKLLIQAYVAHLANFKMNSMVSCSLCYKNPYLKMFITSLIDKSLCEYFTNAYEEIKKGSNKNIFKNGKKSSFTDNELKKLIKKIEEKWALKKE